MSQKRITLPEDLYFAATIEAAKARVSLSAYVANVLTRELAGKASQPVEPKAESLADEVDDTGIPEPMPQPPKQPRESFRTLVATLPQRPEPEPVEAPKLAPVEPPTFEDVDDEPAAPEPEKPAPVVEPPSHDDDEADEPAAPTEADVINALFAGHLKLIKPAVPVGPSEPAPVVAPEPPKPAPVVAAPEPEPTKPAVSDDGYTEEERIAYLEGILSSHVDGPGYTPEEAQRRDARLAAEKPKPKAEDTDDVVNAILAANGINDLKVGSP